MINKLKSLFQFSCYSGKFYELSDLKDFKNSQELIFRDLKEDDFEFSKIFKHKNRKERYLKNLENGFRCKGYVTTDNEVAFYLWYTTGNMAPWFKGMELYLPENDVYIWDCRTAEQWQRKGLYCMALQNISSEVLKRSKRVLIDCSNSNIASQKGILNAGFYPFKNFKVFKIRNVFFVLYGCKILVKRKKKELHLC